MFCTVSDLVCLDPIDIRLFYFRHNMENLTGNSKYLNNQRLGTLFGIKVWVFLIFRFDDELFFTVTIIDTVFDI